MCVGLASSGLMLLSWDIKWYSRLHLGEVNKKTSVNFIE